MAGRASPIVYSGLDGGFLADFETGYAFSDFDYRPGEFVAKGDWDSLFCYGVWFERYKVWAS